MSVIATQAAYVRAGAPIPRIRTNFVWAFGGNVVFSGCQWAMILLLAKAGSPAMLGQFALAQAIAAPPVLFAALQLRAVIVADLSRDYRDSDYLGFRLATLAAAVALVAVPVLWAGSSAARLPLVLTVVLVQAVEAVSDMFYGFHQREHNLARVSTALLSKGVLGLAAMGATLVWTGDLLLAVLALLGSRVVLLATYEMWDGKPLRVGRLLWKSPSWHWPTHARLFRRSAPLGVVSMLGALLVAAPRYFVGGWMGERELGIFSGLASMASVGLLAASAMGNAAFAPLASLYAQRDGRRFARLMTLMCATGLLMGGGGVVVAAVGGAPLLTILFRPEFAGFPREFVLAAAVAGVGYLAAPFGYGMTAARLYAPQVPLLAMAVGTVTVVSALGVRGLGLQGALLALLAGSLVQLAGGALILMHAFRGRKAAEANG